MSISLQHGNQPLAAGTWGLESGSQNSTYNLEPATYDPNAPRPRRCTRHPPAGEAQRSRAGVDWRFVRMRALVISDIHGNLPALEAVLDAAGEFDALWNLGDIVGYGAHPNEVIERVRPLAAVNVRGNHDRVCCGLTSAAGFNPVAALAAAWTQHALSPENLEWLRNVPQGPLRATDRAMCAHGSPLHEDHYIVSMRDAWLPLQRMESAITFIGHTHLQGGF